MKDAKLYSAAAAIAVLAIIAYFLLINPYAPQEPGVETILLAANPVPHSVLIFIAMEKGYFTEQGLKIEMRQFSSGKMALDSMLAGGADLTTVADFPIALATLSNQEFYVVATMGQGDDVKVIARMDRGINSIGDLRGKKIATMKGSSGELFMLKLFALEGISLDSVSIAYLNPPDMPPAIARGDIDAFVIWEPHVSNAEKILGNNAIVFSPKNVYGETWNIAVTPEFVEQKSAAVKKFLRALIKAENFYRENREESVEITQRYSGTTRDSVLAVLDTFEMRIRLEPLLPDQLEEAAEWAINQGIVKTTEVPDFSTIIRADYLKELKPEAVTLN